MKIYDGRNEKKAEEINEWNKLNITSVLNY